MLTDGRTTDGRTDDGVTGILIAHLGAFGSGELKSQKGPSIDRTYQVKVSEKHHGEQLEDHMFNQVLNEARGDLEGNDLGRVVIQHDS